MRLQLVGVAYCKQSSRARDIEDENNNGIDAHPHPLALGTENESGRIDAGEEDAEAGEVDIACFGIRQDGLARYNYCQKKQDRCSPSAPMAQI